MAKKRYHHGDLRDALVAAALRIVEEQGAEGFRLAAASRAVGVTHAAAYKHFADREALLHAVSDVGMVAFGDALRASFDSGTDAAAQYLASGRAVVSFALERPHLYLLIFGRIRRDDLQTLAAPAPGTALAELITMIEHWQANGLLKPGSSSTWALVLWTSVHGLASLVATERIVVTRDEALALADSLLDHVRVGIG